MSSKFEMVGIVEHIGVNHYLLYYNLYLMHFTSIKKEAVIKHMK